MAAESNVGGQERKLDVVQWHGIARTRNAELLCRLAPLSWLGQLKWAFEN